MGKKRWAKTRNWEMSPTEAYFAKRLLEEGYEVVAIREYFSKTDYLLRKDGHEIEFPYYEPIRSESRHTDKPYVEYSIGLLNENLAFRIKFANREGVPSRV